MNILVVDTSTKACVLGVQTPNGIVKDETILGRTHSEEILPRIQRLLASAGVSKKQLDLIIFGQGPGSFTGLRIGVGVVQGLAYGLGIPVVGVSSLACLAQQAFRREGTKYCVAALLARQEEVYFGAYEVKSGIVQPVGHETVAHALDLPKLDVTLPWSGVGDCWQLQSLIETGTGVQLRAVLEVEYPQTEDLLEIGRNEFNLNGGQPAMLAKPRYLRETVAVKPPRK